MWAVRFAGHRVSFAASMLSVLVGPFAQGSLIRIAAGREDGNRSGAERVLFNGRDLEGWRVLDAHCFDAHGAVEVADGRIVLDAGRPATGIAWTGDVPRGAYEVECEAARLEGDDFFCAVTFPVGREFCTFIAGGWGGGTTGLSNVDGASAVDNDTTGYVDVRGGQWYAIRIRVDDLRVRVWIDGRRVVDVERAAHRFSVWWEQEPARPLGITTWHTKAAVRKVVLRTLDAGPPASRE